MVGVLDRCNVLAFLYPRQDPLDLFRFERFRRALLGCTEEPHDARDTENDVLKLFIEHSFDEDVAWQKVAPFFTPFATADLEDCLLRDDDA